MSNHSFTHTYLLHGYAGSPTGSVRTVFQALAASVESSIAFGTVRALELPWSRTNGALPDDSEVERGGRLGLGLGQVKGSLVEDQADPASTLFLGISMGGLLAALVQESFGGDAIALSAPDRVDRYALGGRREHLLAVYSSTNDTVISGRTSNWKNATVLAVDLPDLTHDHDRHVGDLVQVAAHFLLGNRSVLQNRSAASS